MVATEADNLEERLRVIVGGPIFDPLTRAMARHGVLIEYGGLSTEPTPFPLSMALAKKPHAARLSRP